MRVIALDSQYWSAIDKKSDLKSQVIDTVTKAASAAIELLPGEFDFLNIMVEPVTRGYVIPETGVMGITYDATHVSITFDHDCPYGDDNLLKSIRESVFHELVHASTFAHDPWQPSVMFGVVTEGLATVFEREYGSSSPLWGEYIEDGVMEEWYKELKKLPVNATKDSNYFVQHPDGRKWIVYKTGTWMIDQLIASGESLFDLMKLNHGEIIRRFEEI